MKIRTEPARMSRRARRYYDLGYTIGKKEAEASTAAMAARTAHYELGRDLAEHDRLLIEKHRSDAHIQTLQRELAFANDRIEQLMNSVVIIRDKK